VRSAAAFTLTEVVISVALVGVVTSALLPAAARIRSAALTAAGARHIAVSLHALRWKSVALGRSHGLLFDQDAAGWIWYVVSDGNGNGLRTSEVLDGSDPTLSGPHRLEETISGVTLGFPVPRPIPRVPPGQGPIDDLDDPIQIGNTNLLAFGPLGTSSSGTLYVTDRVRRLYAVRLYGKTARITVWFYNTKSGRWTT
jgi:type II secretory pathway pseudopilin PulG